MCRWTTVLLWCLSITSLSRSELFSAEKFRLYASFLNLGLPKSANETGNELWHGLFRDCSKRVTFSCIQKNAYSYLDDAFIERDNITVFDGLTLTRNNVTYEATCPRTSEDQRNDVRENLVDDIGLDDCTDRAEETRSDEEANAGQGRRLEDEPKSPLEEITNALRRKALKFLSTRNYELELPRFFEGATVKISPREVDENGALLRLDFGTREVAEQGRIFKKIRKFIQNKLLTSFLALLLIIKLIKVKFMFVIPFLFGVGTAKKLFLKLLLFFIPAFAHIFKLCSSYHASHATKFHHHHHQIAHHHHHVPVPVPLPAYYDHPHHHHHDVDFDGYDYAHPHIQYRKDMEELKEWGIEPYHEPYEDSSHLNRVPATSSAYQSSYGLPQYATNVKTTFLDNSVSANAHNLAYSGYLNDLKYRRPGTQQQSALSVNPHLSVNLKTPLANLKNPYAAFVPNARPEQPQRLLTPVAAAKSASVPVSPQETDDEYYGPIIARLDDIFGQLRFYEESCRERLVCSMYKNPAVYSPHSNLVSNELSRDPQELKRGVTESASSHRFQRYTNAARRGQDGGDCLHKYPCHVNTE
ncbi:hypothetical protein EAI_15243 [Harpegnathos saltator]|uniref:Uncharacterized protein n=2 Tax=Harpegnathos saltator TaxID=610380 RepID=E2B2X5_HARSA|nr:hypothetical protein EAI_15243 [Harpegnathos saltator]